jgi:excisionase family DNA binding protein
MNTHRETYLTKEEASAYLRCSLRSIDSLLARGELKAYRPSRRLLFKREDLDAFVQRRPAYAEVARALEEAST